MDYDLSGGPLSGGDGGRGEVGGDLSGGSELVAAARETGRGRRWHRLRTLHKAAFRGRVASGTAAAALPLAAQRVGSSSTVPERPLRRASVHQPAVSRQHVASSSG
jgi:hypothetical protein